ncbi:hypothetical protein VNI00_014616 [Paramarasmius palmivorus]|uniref:F-box domain-containing protein n=1 Tax=Paramarasmius palmivorus TaxID=297713 RepID=A0AAW0BSJ0_9AGAR
MSILVEPSQTVLCRRCRMEFVPGPVYPPLSIPQETFRSDYHLPSGEEKNGIRPIIKAEGAELARYDVELKRLREVIEKLEKERDALETRIIERRYFISAQRRIPNEIWDEIFEDVCLSDRYSLAVSRDYVEAHALTLAQVCHRFRQLVKGRPLLWSSICVDLVKLNWDATDLITEYLRASGHADLDVSIQCRG